jgi:predicted phosphohydrolase
MEIQFCSDLHLEFPENAQLLRQQPLQAQAPILILGGDILPFPQFPNFNWFLDSISDTFEQVYWIPGNHEYYFDDASRRSGAFFESIRTNVHLCNQFKLELKEMDVLLCTLWSNVLPRYRNLIQQRLTDFHVIQYGRQAFTPEQYTAMHRNDMRFLELELEQKGRKTAVVTHHAPTFKQYNPQFQNNPINQAFGTELRNLIEHYCPAFWAFGHTHYNPPAFYVGQTPMITNQLGYVRLGENKRFNPNLVLNTTSGF